MATAYDVMSQAKRQGAEIQALENYYDYMEEVKAEEARASKAMYKGAIGGQVGGTIASFLAPAALTALGLGTGGLGSMALAGLIGGAGSYGATELGDFLARQWSMGGKGRSKDFDTSAKMKKLAGPYGQRFGSELQQKGQEVEDAFATAISQELDMQKSGRLASSLFSGLCATGKARAAGGSIANSLTADMAEGYGLGAEETVDWWKELLADFDPSGLGEYKGGFK